MKEKMVDLKKYKNLCIFLVVLFSTSTICFAQDGAGIFERAACNLLDEVLAKNFGSMITVVAGVIAIISSVVGSFRTAWVLVFVSVGIYIFPSIVKIFFPNLSCVVN